MRATVFYLLMLQKYIKAKNSGIKNSLFLGSISRDLQPITWKKTGLNGCVYDFSVGYRVLILVILPICINI